MKLIVGLGNPGIEYAGNRHNIGYMCVRHLGRKHGIRFDKKVGLARTGRGVIAGEEVMLARPQTYMNISGESVKRLVKKLKVKPEDVIVIYDDMDLPLGRVRLRGGGSSSGGHNGIKSIIACLGSQEFSRVKVGIGAPETEEGNAAEKREAVIDHVLSGFSPEERKVIDRAVPVVGEAVECLIAEGLETAMNKYNRRRS
jgi:PTH1 family peptidyl-tRNA hydrolase